MTGKPLTERTDHRLVSGRMYDMICGNCGYENPEGILYCQNCDAQLMVETEPPAEKKEGKTVNLLVLIFAAVVVIGCVIYLVFGKNKTDIPDITTVPAATATDITESPVSTETVAAELTTEKPASAEPQTLPVYSSEADLKLMLFRLNFFDIFEFDRNGEISSKVLNELCTIVMTMVDEEHCYRDEKIAYQYVKKADFLHYAAMLFGDETAQKIFDNIGELTSYDASTDEVAYMYGWGDRSLYDFDFDSPVAVSDKELTYEVCYLFFSDLDVEDMTLTYKFDKVVSNDKLFYQLKSIESGNTVSE